MLERDWQRMVVDLARTLGWERPMHIYDSRRSEPGWPDLSLVRERLVLLELKREHGKVSDAQKHWIASLTHANVEVYVARPRHLDALAAVLSARGTVDRWTAAQREARGELLLELDQHINPQAKEKAA